jgi:hypothetical protein
MSTLQEPCSRKRAEILAQLKEHRIKLCAQLAPAAATGDSDNISNSVGGSSTTIPTDNGNSLILPVLHTQANVLCSDVHTILTQLHVTFVLVLKHHSLYLTILPPHSPLTVSLLITHQHQAQYLEFQHHQVVQVHLYIPVVLVV